MHCKHALLLHYQLPLIYQHIYCRSIMGSDLCFHLFLWLKETSTGLILLLSCSSAERHFFAVFQPHFSSNQDFPCYTGSSRKNTATYTLKQNFDFTVYTTENGVFLHWANTFSKRQEKEKRERKKAKRGKIPVTTTLQANAPKIRFGSLLN